MKKSLILVMLMILIAACTQDMQKLKEENKRLLIQMSNLQNKNDELSTELKKCNKLNKILKEEKSYNYTELANLRNELRTFLKQQIMQIEKLTNKTVLMDYVGGEVIKREGKNLEGKLLVYKGKVFSSGDEIRGVRGFFARDTKIQLKIFRKFENKYVLVGESKLYSVKAGKQYIQLENKIVLDQGDIIGIYFPKGYIDVYYNKVPGGFVILSNTPKLGESINLKEAQFTFSIGLMGYFE
ncbi:conserved hypothetical protein [Deferribacter desulfuricans SSM1]|uniref:Uncharacterized protein n=1 Tax=Deferribacter desulfuricans (strain DSM 14783 / JCM 11476 / NBRC 101012 / SSM1) TaxID=639282 RepID=D3PCF0_DEFDS|nr:hypothetical protein [Deferribacter desulfuricans]BAI80273.1 conserved hypothetical protein [Deferribacter desulfuricans SSM1]